MEGPGGRYAGRLCWCPPRRAEVGRVMSEDAPAEIQAVRRALPRSHRYAPTHARERPRSVGTARTAVRSDHSLRPLWATSEYSPIRRLGPWQAALAGDGASGSAILDHPRCPPALGRRENDRRSRGISDDRGGSGQRFGLGTPERYLSRSVTRAARGTGRLGMRGRRRCR